MSKKREVIIALISITILFITIISAGLLKDKVSDEDLLNSTNPWILETKTNEGQFKISLLINKEGNSLFYLGDEEYQYFAEGAGFKYDYTEESYFWGCLNNAKFSQKFIEIAKMIFGSNSFKNLGREEEVIFQEEANEIRNTPGTGAYETDKCIMNCNAYINSTSAEGNKQLSECSNECVIKNKCGTVSSCNNYDSSGYCGIKEINLLVRDENSKQKYDVHLIVNSSSGEVILGTINSQEIKIISQTGAILASYFNF